MSTKIFVILLVLCYIIPIIAIAIFNQHFIVLSFFISGFICGRISKTKVISLNNSRVKIVPEFPTEDRF